MTVSSVGDRAPTPETVSSMRSRPLQNGFSQSWDPKKGGITDSNDSGEIYLFQHSGVAITGLRSSNYDTDDSIAAAQWISGAVDAIKGTRDDPDAPFSDLDVSAPTKTNPTMGDHLGIGRPLTYSGKKDEHERKGILQGSGMAGKGYVHH